MGNKTGGFIVSDNTPAAELVDIITVSVDKDLSEFERLVEFVRQVIDPEHFMCGPFRITAIYPHDAGAMVDCCRGALI
jgi:hypothetical protein